MGGVEDPDAALEGEEVALPRAEADGARLGTKGLHGATDDVEVREVGEPVFGAAVLGGVKEGLVEIVGWEAAFVCGGLGEGLGS